MNEELQKRLINLGVAASQSARTRKGPPGSANHGEAIRRKRAKRLRQIQRHSRAVTFAVARRDR